MDKGEYWTCRNLPATVSAMDGDQIRAHREARRLTQEQLAAAIGVGVRTIGNWENGMSVPKNRMGLLERFFAGDANGDSADPLRSASEVALLSELLRRAAARGGAVANG